MRNVLAEKLHCAAVARVAQFFFMATVSPFLAFFFLDPREGSMATDSGFCHMASTHLAGVKRKSNVEVSCWFILMMCRSWLDVACSVSVHDSMACARLWPVFARADQVLNVLEA